MEPQPNVSYEFSHLVHTDGADAVPDVLSDPVGDFLMHEQARKAGVPAGLLGVAAGAAIDERGRDLDKAASAVGRVRFEIEEIDGQKFRIGRDHAGREVVCIPEE